MTGMLQEVHAGQRLGIAQWRSGVREWRVRRCCCCHLPIWPGQLHHRVAVISPREGWRRIHYRRCPLAPVAPYSRADRLVDEINCWASAVVCVLFGGGMILAVLLMAGWRP
jgi:hypothetical protein